MVSWLQHGTNIVQLKTLPPNLRGTHLLSFTKYALFRQDLATLQDDIASHPEQSQLVLAHNEQGRYPARPRNDEKTCY